MKRISKLAIAAALLTGAFGATAVALNSNNLLNLADTVVYSCADITFGEDVGSPSTSDNLTDKTNLDKMCSATNLVAGTDFTLTDWTNANYQNKNATTGKFYAVKIGGSKNNKYSGSFTINLVGYTCESAIISATGWSGDSNLMLGINSLDQVAVTATSGTYTYTTYSFSKINSSTLTIKNKTGLTGKGRIVISKIVMKLKKVVA